ncbi:redox-sensing transcriptional repressor Rex [Planctomycetota bacterium]
MKQSKVRCSVKRSKGGLVRFLSQIIPAPVVDRLPKYLTCVRQLEENGSEWVTSDELAESIDTTTSTVRHDLSFVDSSGIPRRGYRTDDLHNAIARALGLDIPTYTVVVGAGNLGCLLAVQLGEDPSGNKFRVCGLFDPDRRRVGKRAGKIIVQSTDKLADVVRKNGVTIGIITVKASIAQSVADQLMEVGVRNFLNLTRQRVATREGVSVVDAHPIAALQKLAAPSKMRQDNISNVAISTRSSRNLKRTMVGKW